MSARRRRRIFFRLSALAHRLVLQVSRTTSPRNNVGIVMSDDVLFVCGECNADGCRSFCAPRFKSSRVFTVAHPCLNPSVTVAKVFWLIWRCIMLATFITGLVLSVMNSSMHRRFSSRLYKCTYRWHEVRKSYLFSLVSHTTALQLRVGSAAG